MLTPKVKTYLNTKPKIYLNPLVLALCAKNDLTWSRTADLNAGTFRRTFNAF